MDEYGVSGVAKSATCDTNFYFHSKETLKGLTFQGLNLLAPERLPIKGF